jgi:uncharacterized protein (DUF983 family)
MGAGEGLSTARILGRGLRGRCPRCGRGGLFTGLLEVTDRCTVCGLEFAGHDAGDAPAVAGIFVLGFAIIGLAGLAERFFQPPLWLHVAVWIPVTIIGAVVLLRPLKGLTIATQFRFRAVDEETRPGGT